MKIITLLFILVCPSIVSAQEVVPENPATHRWYVGIQATAQRYRVVTGMNFRRNSELSVIPWQLTGGYQFSPRFAAQLGFAYREEEGSPTIKRYTALPLSIRYTLGRFQPDKRLRVDAVAGLTTLFVRFDQLLTPDPTLPMNTYFDKFSTTESFVSFGLAPRYRFSSRLEATADFLLNRPLKSNSSASKSFDSILNYYNVGLGLRFRL